MKCKNCGHLIYGRRYNFGRGEVKIEYKHKLGGNYCKVLKYEIDFYGRKCMCNNAEPEKQKGEDLK